MAWNLSPEKKTFVDVGDSALAFSTALALFKLGLLDIGGGVASFSSPGPGIVNMQTTAPTLFSSDGEYVLTLSGCGDYDGDWSVQTNSPTELALLGEVSWHGPGRAGTWKIKQIVENE